VLDSANSFVLATLKPGRKLPKDFYIWMRKNGAANVRVKGRKVSFVIPMRRVATLNKALCGCGFFEDISFRRTQGSLEARRERIN
jgi:hypothetical protein